MARPKMREADKKETITVSISKDLKKQLRKGGNASEQIEEAMGMIFKLIDTLEPEGDTFREKLGSLFAVLKRK